MSLKTPAIDPADISPKTGSAYPKPFDKVAKGRTRRALTNALGLTQFGVNVTELAPGAASALRHWHSHEDEFIYVLSGHPTLVTNDGEQQLYPGTAAGFPAGVENGHCLENRTGETVTILEVGSRDMQDAGHYPDDDLHILPGRYKIVQFTRKNGEPYE